MASLHVLPPVLGIGIVIGTVVTLIMAITVIVLVMIVLKCRRHSKLQGNTIIYNNDIIESVDSISKDERGFPLTQYITNGRISRGGYTFTHFKHHHRVLRLISYRMGV